MMGVKIAAVVAWNPRSGVDVGGRRISRTVRLLEIQAGWMSTWCLKTMACRNMTSRAMFSIEE